MEKGTTIVLLNGFGNHSNRLFQAIHIEAFALEHNLRFYNPSFHDMAHLYHGNPHFFDKIICAPAKILDKMKRIIRFNDKLIVHFDDDGKQEYYQEQLLNLADKAKKYIFVNGWQFRNHELTLKHRQFFQKKYSLREELRPENTFASDSQTSEKHVAVHIRRGDYRNFSGGKYFYEWEVYRQCMDSLKNEIHDKFDCRVKFFVFSDENAEVLKSEDVLISHNQWYVDQFIMSRCDYIIGPPSTFSHWASYIGNAECYHIQNSTDVQLKLENFKCCNG